MTQHALATMPVAGFAPIPTPEANRLIETWGHYLGPCRRPFGSQAWALDIDGRAISVAIGASIVSDHVDGRQRGEVLELARLCTDPAERWATRIMLRMWRELAPSRWPHWQVTALYAYSQDSQGDGRTYRFDGWTKVAERVGYSGGGGAWSRPRYASDAAAGPKTLWRWLP